MKKCTVLVMCRNATLNLAYLTGFFLKKYWEDCPYEIVLNTQTQAPDCDLYDRVIYSDDEMIWGDRLKVAMDNIDTPYTFLLAEDFFLTDTVDNQRFEAAIEMMEKNNVGALWMTEAPVFSKSIKNSSGGWRFVPRTSIYRVCLQPILFKSDYLRRFSGLHFSPWQFERKASLISSYMDEKIMALDKPIFSCIHAWGHGMWMGEAIEFMKNEKIDPQFYEKGKIYPQKNVIKDRLAMLIIRIAPHLITHIRIYQSEKNEKKLNF